MLKFGCHLLSYTLLFSHIPLAQADAQWDALTVEYAHAMTRWHEALSKAQGGSQNGSGIIKISNMTTMPPHPSEKFRPRVRAIAEKLDGKPEAVVSLSWLVRENFGFPGMSSDNNDSKWALATLAENHAASANVLSEMDMLPMIAMSVGEGPLISFLETVAKENPDRQIQAKAQLGIATILYEESPMMRMMGGGQDRTAQKKRAETMLRVLVKDFAGSEMAEKANELLYAIDHLQVGMTAPKTMGVDVDGKEIKLSDYRGKVVLMVYWATWCAPCMQAIPHERELMEKYEGKPFTILGINVDFERNKLKRALKKHKITWPTIYDGIPGMGPITSTWKVNSFPTFVLIDHNGIIQQMGPLLMMMERKIDEMLNEAIKDAR